MLILLRRMTVGYVFDILAAIVYIVKHIYELYDANVVNQRVTIPKDPILPTLHVHGVWQDIWHHGIRVVIVAYL